MQSVEEQRNKAAALLDSGDLAGALQLATAARSIAPNDIPLLQILGDIYDRAGDKKNVLNICGLLATLVPDDPAPRLKAAHIRTQLMDYAGAEAEFSALLKIDPANESGLDGLTDLWRLSGKINEARTLLLKRGDGASAPHLAAIARFKAAFVQPVIAQDRREIDESRGRYAAMLKAGPKAPIHDPLGAGLGPNFFLGYQAANDRVLQEALAAYYLAATPSLAFTAAHIGKRKAGKIRVGIVSNYFSHHTVGYLTYGLIAGLDRTRFELVLFRTPTASQDTGTQRFLAAAPCIDLPSNLDAARAAIAAAELDVLHFPEIGMDHMAYFLAFARLATLQTVAWGHPITTGLPTIDIFISVADMEPPDAAAHYTEKLVALRGLTFAADPPPQLEADRSDAGLKSHPAYVCGQSLYKVHPDFDTTIAQILREDRKGHVYFVSLGGHADTLFKARLAATLGGDLDRVHILPRTTKSGFLKLSKAADVVLDVPHWSGGKTSLETLAMGTPIVHMPGDFMRGRHTLAFYRRMGISAPVVSSTKDYVNTAVRIAHDRDFRGALSVQIKETQSTLFEDWVSIREIEDVWAAALTART